MAIEQGKLSSNAARANVAKAPASVAHNKAAKPEGQESAGFAAILASADTNVEPQMADVASTQSASNAQSTDAQRGPKGERAKQKPDAQPAGEDTCDTAQKTDSPSTSKSSTQDMSDALDAPSNSLADSKLGDASAPLAMPAAQLPATPTSPMAGADVAAQADAPAETALSPTVPDAAERGHMRTSQLQQAQGASAGKGAAHAAFSVAASRASAVVDATENAVLGGAVQMAVPDVRPGVPGKAQVANSVMESGAKMMGLMASVVASQAERGVGFGTERRGQDESRGGAPMQEPMYAESADASGQSTVGFGMEEAPVQETVRYWVGADAKQQAQLTVADVAGSSVDVTIHMHGKEAQVSFRADDQQARDALQASSSQLKNLLGQEGLTLSGMSVGTSSAGQEGRQEPRPGGGAGKTAKVTAVGAEAVLAPAHTRAQGAGGRGSTLDLFV